MVDTVAPPGTKKNHTGLFVKGVDDPRRNKGGKEKHFYEMKLYAQAHTSEAIDKLVEIMRTGTHGEARQAAIYLIDRAMGKPTQAVEHSGTINAHEDALQAIADDLESSREADSAGTCH